VLAPRNLIILAAAVLVLVAGYLMLQAGHASAAAVILVFGYCVLFPIGIALKRVSLITARSLQYD
jgi:hypothetical protein